MSNSYQDYDVAVTEGLVSVSSDNVVRLGVDSTNVYNVSMDDGRPSVRLTSKDSWNNGLFIADFNRMPSSACGSWPAFWALNNNGDWPVGGEIDIVEGQNDAQRNVFAAHAETGCSLPTEGFAGNATRADCGRDELVSSPIFIKPKGSVLSKFRLEPRVYHFRNRRELLW